MVLVQSIDEAAGDELTDKFWLSESLRHDSGGEIFFMVFFREQSVS